MNWSKIANRLPDNTMKKLLVTALSEWALTLYLKNAYRIQYVLYVSFITPVQLMISQDI